MNILRATSSRVVTYKGDKILQWLFTDYKGNKYKLEELLKKGVSEEELSLDHRTALSTWKESKKKEYLDNLVSNEELVRAEKVIKSKAYELVEELRVQLLADVEILNQLAEETIRELEEE